MEARVAHGQLRREAIGLPQVLFQAITHMAPGAAIGRDAGWMGSPAAARERYRLRYTPAQRR
jgi:hypothetical protein